MVSSNNQDHHMNEVEEDEEIDTWIRENNKMPSVTLLKPQIVKFVVKPTNPESVEFSKGILPEEPDE